MSFAIHEVEGPQGQKGFAILQSQDGKPVRALKWIMDGKPVWIDKLSWGWWTMDRHQAEEALAALGVK